MNTYIQETISALPDKPLLTIHEVAVFCRVSKMSIYRWYEKGDLKGCYLKGVLRIYRRSVIALIENGNDKHKDDELSEDVEAKISEVQTKQKPRKQASGWVKNW